MNGVGITISVDHYVDIPAFVAECNRPCVSSMGIYVPQPGHMEIYDSVALRSPSDPKITGIVMGRPSPFGAGGKIQWDISSLDDQPIDVLSVALLPSDEARRFLPR